LINCLSPVVQFLHALSGTLRDALVLVSSSESIRLFRIIILCFRPQIPFPPAKAIFVGIDVLLAVCISFTFH
jgi:hypothetical protein